MLFFNDTATTEIYTLSLHDALPILVIEKKFGAPQITKDGVTVAKEVELENKFENTGAQLVKSVASKTGDDAGDGTTTATILTQAIVTEGLKNVTAGANPMDLKRGIDKAVAAVVAFIKEHAEQVDDNYDKIEQVATVSANNDAEIGKLLADAMRKVSKDGVITIEESKSRDTNIGVVEGMQFDRGYLSGYFMTDADKMECVMDNPYILLYDKKISNLKEFLPILQPAAESGRPLLVIAEDGFWISSSLSFGFTKVHSMPSFFRVTPKRLKVPP